MVLARHKHLLVEGHDDLYALAELLGFHFKWGQEKKERPVNIEACGGIDSILDKTFIETKISSREVAILGIVIDADDAFESRWSSAKDILRGIGSSVPDQLPPEGLIAATREGKRIGLWIMPDNLSRGMLETFMRYLVPDTEEPLWRTAQSAVDQAKSNGAKFKEVHTDKANIFTWLSWQDPPGQTIGRALLGRMLDAHSPYAVPFVKWFESLFDLPRLESV